LHRNVYEKMENENHKIRRKDQKKKANTATTPQESVDHMEKLLTERVYHAEDQTTAFSEMIEEMGQRIFAYNSVKKSPQRILIKNEAESLI